MITITIISCYYLYQTQSVHIHSFFYWIFSSVINTYAKVHEFLVRSHKNMQKCIDSTLIEKKTWKGQLILCFLTQNNAKSAWFFSPVKKTHTRVYDYKPCEICMGFYARRKNPYKGVWLWNMWNLHGFFRPT